MLDVRAAFAYDVAVPNERTIELADLFEDDDTPTLVAPFDLPSYARATATWEDDEAQGDPRSGIRASFPTLPHDIGALPGEPEEDAILRALGGGARVLRVLATCDDLARLALDPEHGVVLALIDGERSVASLLDESAIGRRDTLRAIEELILLAVAG